MEFLIYYPALGSKLMTYQSQVYSHDHDTWASALMLSNSIIHLYFLHLFEIRLYYCMDSTTNFASTSSVFEMKISSPLRRNNSSKILSI